MKITGRIVEISPMVEGVSKSDKPWKKRDLYVEEEGQYPNSLTISFLNDKAEALESLTVGQLVTVEMNTSVREYNGRKFNNINGWKVVSESVVENNQQPPQPSTSEMPQDVGEYDLPF